MDDLKQKLRSLGLVPISAEGFRESREDISFSGSLEEYAEAVTALGSKGVFLCQLAVGEHAFVYREGEYGESGLGEFEVDLCVIEPKLERFKSYVGKCGHVDLWAPFPGGRLVFALNEDWASEWVDLTYNAIECAKDRQRQIVEQQEAREDERVEAILVLVRRLIEDAAFLNLKTLGAMRQYALAAVPGAAELDSSDLNAELKELRAKMEARGLKRK